MQKSIQKRFVSAFGPDRDPDPKEDVRFIKCVAPNFEDALVEKAALDKLGYTTVIYRLSYDVETSELHSSRQFKTKPDERSETDPPLGEETYAKEPASARKLSYEIYSVAEELAAGTGLDLGKAVGKIRALSHQPRPGNGKP